MIIITSAAYIVEELRAEFGFIPPSFLPLGNKRLYSYQIKHLQEVFDDQICLSIPESYIIRKDDIEAINASGVTIIKVPDNISLGYSLLYIIKSKQLRDDISILHGDTIIEDLPKESNAFSIASNNDLYNWEIEHEEDEAEYVWSGFFSFSSSNKLAESLELSNGDFVKGIKIYSNSIPLKRILINVWWDFGHSNTFYKSRSKVTTQRFFNTLQIKEGVVIKSSTDFEKIRAECEWFRNTPESLKVFTPQLVSFSVGERPYYSLEYLYHPTLSELFVFGEQPPFFWSNVFRACFDFLNQCKEIDLSSKINELTFGHSTQNIWSKTLERVAKIEESGIWDTSARFLLNEVQQPSLKELLKDIESQMVDASGQTTFIHGDFCFSNILFDIRANRIKVIDPRGRDFSGKICQYGDNLYDYSKLTHSVIGGYDFIISGMMSIHQDGNNYELNLNFDERIKRIQQEFIRLLIIEGISVKHVYLHMILLFISMVPLHADKPFRQKAFILNSYRLYQIFSNL